MAPLGSPLVDVDHRDPDRDKLLRDELRPVALLRLAFAAHEDDPVASLHAGFERG